MKRITKAINSESIISPVPIWLMRQAGRYLSEYMNVRNTYESFLDLCYSPKDACKVTMQPIDRYNFDAAILFSDILVIPDSLSIPVSFSKNHGPILGVNDPLELYNLKVSRENFQFDKVSDAIGLIKDQLSDKDLIGFSGSPWTLACYILDRKRNASFDEVRKLIYTNPKLLDFLIDILTQQIKIYLEMQVRSGVDVLQLFDSHAGILNHENYVKYVLKPTKDIVSFIKSKFDVPIIGFPKGSGAFYKEFVEYTKVDAVSVDYLTDFNDTGVMNLVTVQGNLDPIVLFSSKEVIQLEIDKILSQVGTSPFIFNLGHGILPKTPVENVEFLVNYIRKVT